MGLTTNAPGLVPHQIKAALDTNYLSFTGASGGNFAQQYLPELYEAEVERFGNRTLSGFLRMVGAEMPMTSDQVVWSEQNRLHIAYRAATVTAAPAANCGPDFQRPAPRPDPRRRSGVDPCLALCPKALRRGSSSPGDGTDRS